MSFYIHFLPLEQFSFFFSVLYYKRKNTEKKIKDEGCVVDLLTNHSNKINFRTGVKIKPADCLKNCSRQAFPFDGASDNTLVYFLRNLTSILF